MTLPTNGITLDITRRSMPPYHLSLDLRQATLAALPPPPPEAAIAWRPARIARWMRKVSARVPTNATQARMGADILIVWEMAGAIAAQVFVPEVTVPRMCLIGRASGEWMRTAAALVRTPDRTQRRPAPLCEAVSGGEADGGVVDGGWGEDPAGGGGRGCGRWEGDLTAGTAAAGMAGTGPAMTMGVEGRGIHGVTAAARSEIPYIDPLQQSASPEATPAPGLPGVAACLMHDTGGRRVTEALA